ncbi:methyltransferase-like protein 22 [Drosophila ficusphila]|uniref:methyltransferase-like protein 22 n=1 Tax=Drosophila ficusphila TaxID=30025 RepID=UPI0007E6390A|nr:methyltransferase-like protein 22 [Drosophila ficusphila]
MLLARCIHNPIMFTVTSEIYGETNYQTSRDDGKVVSKFRFIYPEEKLTGIKEDKDGDLEVPRPRRGVIELEHSEATELRLVGLQVWRGALLLADYLFSKKDEFSGKTLMELGAGVGLTSIAAGIHNPGRIYCTDVDLGCILKLIRGNVQRNSKLLTGKISVLEFDFLAPKEEQSQELVEAIDNSDIILAADVIYSDTLTDAFISVVDNLLNRGRQTGRPKTIYVALEKRYVFTLEDCDSVAPMYEYLIRQTINKPWNLEHLPLDFPQYFEYDRCKQLILIKITSR